MPSANEPDWKSLMPDGDGGADNSAWRQRASEEWHTIMGDIEAAGTFTSGNAHSVKALAIARVRYEMACAELFRGDGAVAKTPNGEERLRQVHCVMKQVGDEAMGLEMELGLTPRRRGAVTKAPKKQATASKASLYLIDAKRKQAGNAGP